jgi:hypothetical protein
MEDAKIRLGGGTAAVYKYMRDGPKYDLMIAGILAASLMLITTRSLVAMLPHPSQVSGACPATPVSHRWTSRNPGQASTTTAPAYAQPVTQLPPAAGRTPVRASTMTERFSMQR